MSDFNILVEDKGRQWIDYYKPKWSTDMRQASEETIYQYPSPMHTSIHAVDGTDTYVFNCYIINNNSDADLDLTLNKSEFFPSTITAAYVLNGSAISSWEHSFTLSAGTKQLLAVTITTTSATAGQCGTLELSLTSDDSDIEDHAKLGVVIYPTSYTDFQKEIEVLSLDTSLHPSDYTYTAQVSITNMLQAEAEYLIQQLYANINGVKFSAYKLLRDLIIYKVISRLLVKTMISSPGKAPSLNAIMRVIDSKITKLEHQLQDRYL